MRCKFDTARKLTICGLIAVTAASTGCKSGWKMPGASMFSWKKKPSEETLAGKGPSTTLPASPAASQSPNLLAGSKATTVKPSPYAPPARPTAGAATASVASNGLTPSPWPNAQATAATNNGFGAPTNPGMGTAATANGYTTGPYQTVAQSNPYAAAGSTFNNAANGMQQATAQAANMAQQMQNAGVAARTASTNVYQGVQANGYSMPQQQIAQQSSMPNAIPGGVPSQGFAMPTSAPAGQLAMPGPGGVAAAGFPTTPTNVGLTPSTPAYAPIGAPATGSLASPSSNFANSASTPATPATFRPGSTQRATGYDFSNGGASATTASGTSNPGYQLPPNTTINR